MDTSEIVSTSENVASISRAFLATNKTKLAEQNNTGIDLGETGRGLFGDLDPVLDLSVIASSLDTIN